MNNQNNVNTLDEALRVIWLESSKEANIESSEKEINTVLNANYSIKMDTEKESLMMEKLNPALANLSFGNILTTKMSEGSIVDEILASKTNLPVEVIEDLKADSIYTNNIPVVLLKDLLLFLNISFKSAEQSILKTFDMLQSQIEFKSNESSVFKPAYRKGYHASKEATIWNAPKSDGKELFENKESLDKYLQRLNELIKE